MVRLTSRDSLDTATASKTSDSGLGDALDVVAKNLAMALGTALAETLAALAAYEESLVGHYIETWDANGKRHVENTYVQSWWMMK